MRAPARTSWRQRPPRGASCASRRGPRPMTTVILPAAARSPWPGRLLWLLLLIATIAFAHLPRGILTGLWKDVPATLHLPLAAWLSAFMDWLVTDARL